MIDGIMNWVSYLCALYDKHETICVHYVCGCYVKVIGINDISDPMMLADKDLVVILWHLGHRYYSR